jgi:hypothetical protein
MPKEVIRARPETDDGAGPYVRVGWGHASEVVEIGTAVPDGCGQLRLPNPDNVNEWNPIILDGYDVGWFVQLDRVGINRLIRTLRKARDSAFGRDE